MRFTASLLVVLLAAMPIAGQLCDASCDAAVATHHHHHGMAMPDGAAAHHAPQAPDRCGHDHVSSRIALAAANAAPAAPAVTALLVVLPTFAPTHATPVLHLHRPPDLRSHAPLVLRI